MKILNILVILMFVSLGTFILGCSSGDSDDDDAADDDSTVDDDDDDQDEPHIVNTSNTDCKEFTKDEEPEEGIDFSYEDGVLTVFHTNVEYNCCLERVDVEMEISNFVIDLYETEIAPNPCDCLCLYDVVTQIAGLESGNYTVNIYVYGALSISGEVTIP